jgi:uncharacterized membrane protein
MVGALVMAPVIRWFDSQTGWTLPVSAEDARVVAGNLTGALLTFIVFVFSVLLVALQLASAQLTPRVIGRMLRDPVTKAALGIFSFAYTFSLAFISRLHDPVPFLSGVLSAYGSLACVAVFLILIDRLGNEMRAVRVLAVVAAEGREVIRSTYPEQVICTNTGGASAADSPLDGAASTSPGPLRDVAAPPRLVEYREASAYVLAFDNAGLLKLARQADCLIELVPQVGDFVATGDLLFRVYPAGAPVSDEVLRQAVALGPERTLTQDPTFVFRIIVDIAAKALSPGINDPTTAVLAIDQLHHLLREAGSRRLDTGQIRDADNRLRLLYRTPDWEDFVSLAVTKIRHYGGASIQVARRLRAMLENLIQSLPEQRGRLLRQELTLLQRKVERTFNDPEDRTRADIADFQGVGGSKRV